MFTIEQFTEMVEKMAKELGINVDCNSAEAKEFINDEYKYASKRLKEGLITEEVFKNGCVSAVVNNLYMMF